MAENTDIQVNISGIAPAKSGKDSKYGNWVLFDQSGDFSFDRSVVATIWLVGGGCDGTAGEWNGNTVTNGGDPTPDTGTGISYSGAGGDGGYVLSVMNVKIPKGATLTAVIADKNERNGTSLDVGNFLYKCDQAGFESRTGGAMGSIPTAETGKQWANQDDAVTSGNGENGVLTPYGYVGSSGGGGAVCNGQVDASNGVKGGAGAGSGTNHRGAGTDAVNYGCGGGGGAICGWVAQGQAGGNGKQGCIIIAYVADQKTLIVQKHYKRVCNTKKTCNTDYYSSSSRRSCGGCGCGANEHAGEQYVYTDSININPSADELERRADELEARVGEINEENTKLQNKLDELQPRVD